MFNDQLDKEMSHSARIFPSFQRPGVVNKTMENSTKKLMFQGTAMEFQVTSVVDKMKLTNWKAMRT